MAKAVTNTQHYTDIANAIRSRTGKSGALKPSQMAAEIQDIPDDPKWVRPQELPDYSKITFSSTDEVLYMTYDTQLKNAHSNFVGFVINGTATIIEWGTLNNGTFTVAGTANLGSGGTYRATLPSNLGRYIVYRIRPNGTGHITRYYLASSDVVVNSQRIDSARQPMIEVYCRLPYLNNLSGYLTSQYSVSFTHYGAISPTSMYNAFAYSYYLEHIFFESLNTANCVSFAGAFRNCYHLIHMDFDLTVTNKCTTMATMFYCVRNLRYLPFDLSTWDVSKVTSFADTFNSCMSMRYLDVNGWDVSSAVQFSSMFSSCYVLSGLDVSQWEAPKCNTVYAMFYCCQCLDEIDISNLNTTLITNARYLFYNSTSLKKVKVNNLITNKCTDMREIFQNDTALIEIEGLDTWDTSGATMISSCFYNINNMSEIDISSWNLSGVTAIANAATIFRYCQNTEVIRLPSTLKYLGSYCFGGMSVVREYHFTSTTPATLTDNNSITKYAATKIYVPVGSLNAYKTAWPAFADNIFEEGT